MFSLIANPNNTIKDDLLSGLTVAFALVPEAIAFAFVAGVEPLVGLYAAFIVGFITSIIGGRPGMISGATGALAVVMVSLVAQHGVEYLFATVVLMGIIQIIAGVLRLGKFVRLIPHSVMLGFVNGLAIVIFLAQLGQFKIKGAWITGSTLLIMLALVFATMLIIQFLPKLTKAIPAPLVAIAVITLITNVFNLGTTTVGDLATNIAGGLPKFHIPNVPFDLENMKIILPYALILASIGLIESLMTLTLVDEVTNTRGQGNRECVGQGVANVVTGFFGGMGGCAMIGQSMINVNSGGRGRLSGITAALTLLGFILFGSSLLKMIPVAALVGVMFMVVLGTFEWSSFRILSKIPKSDAFVVVLVSSITVFTDLAIAVASGVVVSALVFAWNSASNILSDSVINEDGSKTYALRGPLFFGSVQHFLEIFDAEKDPEKVIIDFNRCRVYDHSSLKAINTLAEKYKTAGKQLQIRHLSKECQIILNKAGTMVVADITEDPQYHVATDKLA
ncbi:MAG: SulP family sulfate permease [bacterium]|jgi:SulP family sulfate permease